MVCGLMVLERWTQIQRLELDIDSLPLHMHIMTLDKVFTHMCLCHQSS